jgi:crotonobetainyl-CoA:carnitine CoA-transferase CaiB-like acyl-CoA transferase
VDIEAGSERGALRGPLEGLLVFDASWTAPGAITSMLLADYGARVVKVERPDTEARPRPDGSLAHEVLARKVWDRNKWSIALDVAAPADRERLHRLLGNADVFIESYGPGRAEQLGVGHGQLAAVNPRLVHASITGYPIGSPWSDRPGYDALVAARIGEMGEQDGPSKRPHFLGHPSTLYSTALLTASGVLAALRARHHTGRGQRVDASLLDGVMALSTMNWWWNEKEVSYLARSGTELGFGRSRIITDLFVCGDGEWLVIHTGGTGGFKRAMDILGVGDRIREIPGLETAVELNDEEHHAARVLAPAAFAARPRAEWIELFHAADLAALPVQRPTEVMADEQVAYSNLLVDVPDADLGTLRQVGRCITFSLSQPLGPQPAPARDQHRAEVEALAAMPRSAQSDAAGSDTARLAHPLEGLRILDFSSYFAAPYAARLLSDLGADVIKVEATTGDLMRPLPDPFEGAQRGKRTIAVDLKDPRGLQIVDDLVRTADVVMHNFRPGKAESAGIGYERLKALRPDLVYCYLPGFGSSGPKAHLKSFAPLLSGFVGLFYEGAGQGQPPVRRVMGNEDYYNGLCGAAAVLMAIECRYRTGQGQLVESAQLNSALFATSHNFLDGSGRPQLPFVLDPDQLGWDPLYRLYATADGWLCVACVGRRARAALANALGVEGSVGTLGVETGDGDDAAALGRALGERLATMTSDEAFAWLDAAGVPCEIALDYPLMPELLWDEWLLGHDRVLEQQHPLWGYVREIGELIHTTDPPPVRRGTGPLLGEHTREILSELGYDGDTITTLHADGVCVVHKPAVDESTDEPSDEQVG